VSHPSGLTPPDHLAARFEADRRVMAEVMPQMRHYVWTGGAYGALAQGVVDVDVGAGCFEQVALDIAFGQRYPRTPPRVFDVNHRWRPDSDRHLLDTHEFCLWLDRVDPPDMSTPQGLRTFLLQMLPFLRDQFVFDDLGRWPGRDWPHGLRAAYAQHIVEQLEITTPEMIDTLWPLVLGQSVRRDKRCPCGSGIPYRRCHRDDIESLSWVRGLEVCDSLPTAVKERVAGVA
jgi:SEC-C motif-containing protein